ncbi:MAG: BON domain-containing protein [Bryobacterales bacterium]|nr:BON domain-containing protein [Bryobacterales bacterium]
MKFLLFLLVLAVPLVAGEATAKPQAKPASPAAKTTVKPAATKPAVADAEIERTFKAKVAKSKVGVNDIQIRVANGVATLEGRVNVVQHKGTATRMAKSAGARQVFNNIKVSDAARQKAGQQLARARKAQVKSQ